MLVSKPSGGGYVFSHLDNKTYIKYAENYSKAKRVGLAFVYGWATSVGVYDVVLDLMKGVVVQYGKEKFAIVILNTAGLVLSPVVCVLTNVSRVVNTAKRVHSCCAFVFECIDDSANLAWLILDLPLFGQPIPVGKKHRYDFFGNFSDILNKDD
jgi:hypothetical protein